MPSHFTKSSDSIGGGGTPREKVAFCLILPDNETLDNEISFTTLRFFNDMESISPKNERGETKYLIQSKYVDLPRR